MTAAMTHRILLAGATGVIGRRLVPLLLQAGHQVVGTTRSADRAADLEARGVTALVVDVFDAAPLEEAVVRVRPDIVIHQLTDLPRGLDPARVAEGVARNARIRSEGTAHLVAAARAAGARRIVAQSIAWAYAPGPTPFREHDPLDLNAGGARAISVGGVAALERQVLGATPLEGVVLRYGQLYGPGTGADQPTGLVSPLHVDAAAHAALLAIGNGRPGIFNIADDGTQVDITRAREQLGWDPSFRVRR